MRSWSKFVALLMLALWLPATQHCDLEAAGINFLTHEDHASSSCEDACKDDICHNVEGAAFTKEAGALRVLPPPEFTLCACLLHLVEPPLAEPQLACSPGDLSPELLVLRGTWAFVYRTALPARAPDCVA